MFLAFINHIFFYKATLLPINYLITLKYSPASKDRMMLIYFLLFTCFQDNNSFPTKLQPKTHNKSYVLFNHYSC